jgi:hypothetical protein
MQVTCMEEVTHQLEDHVFRPSSNICLTYRVSSVGVVTKLRAGRSWNRLFAGRSYKLLSKTSSQAVGRCQPASDCVPGVKRPGRECGHSYLLSFADKDDWSCITPLL